MRTEPLVSCVCLFSFLFLLAPSSGVLSEASAQEADRPIEVLRVEISPKPAKLGDEITVTGNFGNTTGRLLLVNARVLLPEQVDPVLPEVEQIVFMEAGTTRQVSWRAKVVGEGQWSVRVSPEVISEGRPLNGPRPEISAVVREAFRKSWAGTWTSPDGYVYDAQLRLQLQESGAVEGRLHWTLKKSPESRPDYAGKIGAKGIEYIWGTYDPATRSLDMQGYRRDDPKQILGLDKYRLTLSERNDEITGATRNHGTWKAAFTLSPVESDPAKESAVKAALAALRNALALYELDTGMLPTTDQGLQGLWSKPEGVQGWKGPYVQGETPPSDPWGNAYGYRSPGTKNPNGYDLFSCGPDGKPDTGDDIGR